MPDMPGEKYSLPHRIYLGEKNLWSFEKNHSKMQKMGQNTLCLITFFPQDQIFEANSMLISRDWRFEKSQNCDGYI